MRYVSGAVVLAMLSAAVFGDIQWKGAALSTWTSSTARCHARVENGLLKAVVTGADPQLYSGTFDYAPQPGDVIVIRAKAPAAGTGEFYWMPPNKPAVAERGAFFSWKKSDSIVEYRVVPHWEADAKISRIRIDIADGVGREYEIESIAIRSAPDAPLAKGDAAGSVGITFTYAASERGKGEIKWSSTGKPGLQTTKFDFLGDGNEHSYFINLSSCSAWKGTVRIHEAVDGLGNQIKLGDLSFASADRQFPADLQVKSIFAEGALHRCGRMVKIDTLLYNGGTEDAENLTITLEHDVKGLKFKGWDVTSLYGGEKANLQATAKFDQPGEYELPLIISAKGVKSARVPLKIKVTPQVEINPQTALVPNIPECAYDLAALYFPGWNSQYAWNRIRTVCPERRPVLGWYNEAEPSNVEWQLKYLAECGIRTLYVDWYWHKGSVSLDHWLKSYYRCENRKYVKWAMMYANHNPSGSHSAADQRAVTKYWIDNYFRTPEYLKIGGKPVVWYWLAENLNRDAYKEGGAKALLEISRQMAKEAGFPGIHFIAMKFPETDCSENLVKYYRDMGFDMTSIYHYMGIGPNRSHKGSTYPFSWVADANPGFWEERRKAGVLPFLASISTGWDDRPWNNHTEITGKNVADFRRICVAAKAFADKTGLKSFCLSPLNEWGEGSYAEPNSEHGFGFYEAVRDVFCKEPRSGFKPYYEPADAGLAAVEFEMPERVERLMKWDFSIRKELYGGWKAVWGIDHIAGNNFRSSSGDPAFIAYLPPVNGFKIKKVAIRVNLKNAKGWAQLFWGHDTMSLSEKRQVTVPIRDGDFEYVFDVGKHPEWKGRHEILRFDPCVNKGAEIEFKSVRLIEE